MPSVPGFGATAADERGDAGAFCEELGRSQRSLGQIDRRPGLAMIAARAPVAVLENLKTLHANDGHQSLATIASASSAPCFRPSSHRSRSCTSKRLSPLAKARSAGALDVETLHRAPAMVGRLSLGEHPLGYYCDLQRCGRHQASSIDALTGPDAIGGRSTPASIRRLISVKRSPDRTSQCAGSAIHRLKLHRTG